MGKFFKEQTVELDMPKNGLKQVGDVQQSVLRSTSLVHFNVQLDNIDERRTWKQSKNS